MGLHKNLPAEPSETTILQKMVALILCCQKTERSSPRRWDEAHTAFYLPFALRGEPAGAERGGEP